MVRRVVEFAALCIDTLLAAPAGEGGIQERIGTGHGGLNADGLAICHVQFYHNAAAGNCVQILSSDVAETISGILLAESSAEEAVIVVKNAETQMIRQRIRAIMRLVMFRSS